MTRSQLGGALAALVMLALVGATSCTTKPDVTKSELNDSAIGAPARLRFETVRSILEDSKGNYWFGSWKEGVCRFDGKSLTYFTVEDGLSDNQIRSIHEDRNGVVWFEGGVGISGFDGEKIITPTNRNYTFEGRVAAGDGRPVVQGGWGRRGDRDRRAAGCVSVRRKDLHLPGIPCPRGSCQGQCLRDHRHCQGEKREALVRNVHRGVRIRRRVLHHHR